MSVQALFDTMTKLIEIHEAVILLAKEKKDMLVQGNIDAVNRIVHKETQFIKAIQTLDNQRMNQVSDILIQRGFRPNPNVTITDLGKVLFKAEDKKQMVTLRDTLVERITELKRLNELNQQLVQQSLAFLNYSIDLMLGPSEEDSFYYNEQKQTPTYGKNGWFDARA